LAEYVGLFTVAFLAATILPAYSEVLFGGLLAAGYDPLGLWLVATVGNTLGSAVNWLLGRYLLHFQDRRWFPFPRNTLDSAQRWFQRFGVWSLLLAWAPVGGDALTFIAGIMRVRFSVFLLLTGIGKGARYAILMGLINIVGQTIGGTAQAVPPSAQTVTEPISASSVALPPDAVVSTLMARSTTNGTTSSASQTSVTIRPSRSARLRRSSASSLRPAS
jgi:membrane protein YqaA with SNARE-associated domain